MNTPLVQHQATALGHRQGPTNRIRTSPHPPTSKTNSPRLGGKLSTRGRRRDRRGAPPGASRCRRGVRRRRVAAGERRRLRVVRRRRVGGRRGHIARPVPAAVADERPVDGHDGGQPARVARLLPRSRSPPPHRRVRRRPRRPLGARPARLRRRPAAPGRVARRRRAPPRRGHGGDGRGRRLRRRAPPPRRDGAGCHRPGARRRRGRVRGSGAGPVRHPQIPRRDPRGARREPGRLT